MDPVLGRFTTPDPVRDFVNPYSYVRNNPMNRIDPTGTTSAPRTIYNMIWINSFTQFKNDDEDIFFDVESKLEKAERALSDAIQAAEDMAAQSETKEDADYWNGIADALFELYLNDSWTVSFNMEAKRGAALQYSGLTGNYTLFINSMYLNEEHSDYLTGFIIHEGAHYRFDKDYKRDYTRFAKAGDDLKTAERRYERQGEEFAWEAQIRYSYANPPKSTARTNQEVVRTFNEINQNYIRKGMEWTIDDIIFRMYPDLYPY